MAKTKDSPIFRARW